MFAFAMLCLSGRRIARLCALVFLWRFVQIKHWIIAPYYRGLAVQARNLYRSSDLFQLRWQALGYAYAEESFEGDIALLFFARARREHWRIRLRIFIDATLGREPRAYDLESDEGGER